MFGCLSTKCHGALKIRFASASILEASTGPGRKLQHSEVHRHPAVHGLHVPRDAAALGFGWDRLTGESEATRLGPGQSFEMIFIGWGG